VTLPLLAVATIRPSEIIKVPRSIGGPETGNTHRAVRFMFAMERTLRAS
jgi:hypothetical protein